MARLSSPASSGSGGAKQPAATEPLADSQLPQAPQQQAKWRAALPKASVASLTASLPSAAQARDKLSAWTPSVQRPAFLTRSVGQQTSPAQPVTPGQAEAAVAPSAEETRCRPAALHDLCASSPPGTA